MFRTVSISERERPAIPSSLSDHLQLWLRAPCTDRWRREGAPTTSSSFMGKDFGERCPGALLDWNLLRACVPANAKLMFIVYLLFSNTAWLACIASRPNNSEPWHMRDVSGMFQRFVFQRFGGRGAKASGLCLQCYGSDHCINHITSIRQAQSCANQIRRSCVPQGGKSIDTHILQHHFNIIVTKSSPRNLA